MTSLAGSPLPNAAALLFLAALTVLALATKHRLPGALFAVLTATFLATVVVKNVMYGRLISGPRAENSMDAHRNYASVLGALSWVQLAVMVGVLLVAFMLGRLFWLASFVAAVCAFALDSTDDWRKVYASQPADRPVHYVMVYPWVHWVLTALMVLSVLMAIISLSRRPKPGTRQS